MKPKKNTGIVFYIIIIILTIIVGILAIHVANVQDTLLSKYEESKDKKNESKPNIFDAWSDGVEKFEKTPFDLTINNRAIKYFGIILLIGGAAVVYVISTSKKTLNGKEHGSAEWASKKEEKELADKDDEKNIILTNAVHVSLDTRTTRKNNNIICIGGSGAGKTRFFIKPNIMQKNTSYVITDPKGELLQSTGKFLEQAGYEVKLFNLIDREHSCGYNPFNYIEKESDVFKVINTLIRNTTPKEQKGGDPFWEKSETALLEAIFFYLWLEQPKEKQNFASVLSMLRMAKVSEEDEDFESDLDILFSEVGEKKPNHIAVKQYNIYKLAGGKTAKSILVSVGVRLSVFNLEEISNLMLVDTLDLKHIGDKKTVLYVVIPDSDPSFNFLVAMMYTQLFDQLYNQADFGETNGVKNNGRLKNHVRFLLDEFANIGEIPDFQKLIATMRSREISVSIVIQNLAQLKEMYKDSWESITGNCDSFLFLGGQEQTTLEYVSKKLGKATIDKSSHGRSYGKSGSASNNWDVLARELMLPDEVGKMLDSDCILFIRGMNPFYGKKFIIEKHKNYKYLSDSDKANIYDFKTKFCISDYSEKKSYYTFYANTVEKSKININIEEKNTIEQSTNVKEETKEHVDELLSDFGLLTTSEINSCLFEMLPDNFVL